MHQIDMSKKIFKHWWISLIVGVLSIITGICCFATPASSFAVMTTFFMAMFFVSGIFNTVSAATNRNWNDNWGWDLARGIIEILLGIWLFMLPLPLVSTTLVYVFGFLMLFHSITGICESCELSKIPIRGWGWLLGCSILSLICSFIYLVTPIYGGIFILVFIGISFILYGIFRIILSFKFRKFNKSINDDDFIEIDVY